MRLNAQQLAGHLKTQLAPVYLIAGEEPLLVDECVAAVRTAAQERGYDERERFSVESGFDWDRLLALVRSPSLFAARRLIELRLPGAGPGEAGAAAIVRLSSEPSADALLLLSAGRLDKRAQGSRWVRALEAAGVFVPVYPLEAAAMPRWVEGRMRACGLSPAPGVAELLSHHFEGNLLGVSQEIEKLALLHEAGTLQPDDIAAEVGDNGRFNVFNLVDSCLRGEPTATARILDGLRAEGVEPVLILRLLTREARTVAQLCARLARGEPQPRVLETAGGWPKRRALLAQALKRDAPTWHQALRRAARADRVLTGRASGDIWQELRCLALGICGVPLGAEVNALADDLH